jgi:hypothetical protein
MGRDALFGDEIGIESRGRAENRFLVGADREGQLPVVQSITHIVEDGGMIEIEFEVHREGPGLPAGIVTDRDSHRPGQSLNVVLRARAGQGHGIRIARGTGRSGHGRSNRRTLVPTGGVIGRAIADPEELNLYGVRRAPGRGGPMPQPQGDLFHVVILRARVRFDERRSVPSNQHDGIPPVEAHPRRHEKNGRVRAGSNRAVKGVLPLVVAGAAEQI